MGWNIHCTDWRSISNNSNQGDWHYFTLNILLLEKQIIDYLNEIKKQVFDYDWGLQDDFMGSALLDLTSLELSRVNELTIPLEDSSRPSSTNFASKSMFSKKKSNCCLSIFRIWLYRLKWLKWNKLFLKCG